MARATDRPKKKLSNSRWSAISQLTLIEHCLCPLEPPTGGFLHEPHYYFYKNSKKHLGTAQVDCPLGLNPKDERSLWRLVALAMSADTPDLRLYAGVRYLLRHLDIAAGGRNRKQVRETIRRLGNVVYRNENFFDPVRKEYREVKFTFFSYNIPKDDESFRPWIITFDPTFFEFCQVWGGFLGFHFARYSSLRPAAGRLLLWLKKMLYRDKTVTSFVDVEFLCVNVLGFTLNLAPGEYNKRLRKCAAELAAKEIIELPEGEKGLCDKLNKGKFRVRFHRGPKFEDAVHRGLDEQDNPAEELLRRIGLDRYAIQRTLQTFDIDVINEGADITLARMERKLGFSRSPQAFFVDYVQKRTSGDIAPPDWWRKLKKEEEQAEFDAAMRKLNFVQAPEKEPRESWETEFRTFLRSDDGRREYEQLSREVFGGDGRAALEQMRRRFSSERRVEEEGPMLIRNLFKSI